MKKLLLLAVTFVAAFSVMAQKPDDVMKVSADKYDFGKIKQSVPVTTYFDVKNISDKPLVVENAWAGCGCTTPEISKEPLAPNGVTKLKVGYNAAAMGHFDKVVFIKVAGVTDPKQIMITGEVLDAASYDTYVNSDEYKKLQAQKEAEANKTTDKQKTKGSKTKTKEKTNTGTTTSGTN